MNFIKLYAVGFVVCFALDLVWLGVVAKNMYQRMIGSLMRPDIQWVPGVLFYAIYVAAIVAFVAIPAIEKGSLARAVGMGAFFGLAAYAAFDLTCLALFRDFPLKMALVDLAWGMTLTAVTAAAVFAAAPHVT